MPRPKHFFRSFGPGLVTGASDDDPSGIATYTQTGAQFGYRLLWFALLTTPLMIAVQEMSARLGLVTGQGLATLIRKRYSATIALVISLMLLIANIINIGADLGALAEVSVLVLPGPGWLYTVVFAVAIVWLEIKLSYRRYVHILKWLTLSLLLYVAVAFSVKVDWAAVWAGTFWPQAPLTPAFWALAVAILGTTISPYLFFWQTSEEVEEHPRLDRRPSDVSIAQRLQAMRRDTIAGMVFSNLIMFFIIVAAAATLHQAGITQVTTAAQAAEVLRPVAGDFTFILFSLGIIGTGLLAIPILAGSAAYAVTEVMRQPEGLSKQFRQAHAFYGVIIVAIGLGVFVQAVGVSAVQLLLSAAIVNGLLAPIMLFFILRLADDQTLVGRFHSSPGYRFLGWLTFSIMVIAILIFTWQKL